MTDIELNAILEAYDNKCRVNQEIERIQTASIVNCLVTETVAPDKLYRLPWDKELNEVKPEKPVIDMDKINRLTETLNKANNGTK
jgi:hypothetical protein